MLVPSDDDSESDFDAAINDEEMPFGQPEPEKEDSATPDDDEEDTYADPPLGETPAAVSSPPPVSSAKRRATVEEVEDEDERYVQDFPDDLEAGAALEECQTYFETLRERQKASGQAPWYPFESEEEWELAKWLMTSGLSQKKTGEYLKLKKVCTLPRNLVLLLIDSLQVREGINPSFPNNRAFLKYVDALPEGPGWFCHPFELKGDEKDDEGQPMREIVEMWYRDPVECIRELVGNPSFIKQGYKPIRVYKSFEDERYTNREFSEMWTADWWWKIQVKRATRFLEQTTDHATGTTSPPVQRWHPLSSRPTRRS